MPGMPMDMGGMPGGGYGMAGGMPGMPMDMGGMDGFGALMAETGGAAANPGFDYAAHLAATSNYNNPSPGVNNPQQPQEIQPSFTASNNNEVITGGNGSQNMSNGGFNNVVFNYTSQSEPNLTGELRGDTINGGFYRGPGDFSSSNSQGLGPNDILQFDVALPLNYNGTSLSSLGSNQTISSSTTFAGGGGLEFGLINLSNNIIAAIDVDGNGVFNNGDMALDVQDDVTAAVYNSNNDVFTFVV